MPVVELADRTRLRAYYRRDPALHVYELGDLDDFFWPRTRWFALEPAVALVYDDTTLIALGDPTALAPLLGELRDRLPARLHAHLSPGLLGVLADRYRVERRAECLKMVLARRDAAVAADVVRLGPADHAELRAFYDASYPDHWFDPRMLATGHYVGVRDGGLVAAAGVHVYAPAEGVAALGNIAVAPDRRGHGLGARVTAAVCESLAGIAHVGLNVRADNRAAIACYERLGFTPIARYDEALLTSP